MNRSTALIFAVCLAAPMAFAGGSAAEIIYPPEREAEASKAPEQKPVIVVFKQKLLVRVVVKHGESRAERRRRALFQNWTGFHKVYSGDQYPF